MGWGWAVARAGCPRCRAWDAWPGRDWTRECNYSAGVREPTPSGFYPGRRWNTAGVKGRDQGTHSTRGTPDHTLPSRLDTPSTWIQRQLGDFTAQHTHTNASIRAREPPKRNQNWTDSRNRAAFHTHNHKIRCNQSSGNNARQHDQPLPPSRLNDITTFVISQLKPDW